MVEKRKIREVVHVNFACERNNDTIPPEAHSADFTAKRELADYTANEHEVREWARGEAMRSASNTHCSGFGGHPRSSAGAGNKEDSPRLHQVENRAACKTNPHNAPLSSWGIAEYGRRQQEPKYCIEKASRRYQYLLCRWEKRENMDSCTYKVVAATLAHEEKSLRNVSLKGSQLYIRKPSSVPTAKHPAKSAAWGALKTHLRSKMLLD